MFLSTDRYMLCYILPDNFLCRSLCTQYNYQYKYFYTPGNCLYMSLCTPDNYLCKSLCTLDSHRYTSRCMSLYSSRCIRNKGQYIHYDNLFQTCLQPLYSPMH